MAQLDLGYTASPLTPAAAYSALYADTAGVPKYKDPAGGIHSLGGLSNWYDVTAYGVLSTNTAAQNVTAMNTLLGTTAPAGATIYFPAGIYQFNAKWGTSGVFPNKMFTFQGQGSNRAGSPATAYTEIQLTANLSGSFITLPDTYWYTQFYNMVFTTTVAQTAGAVIASGSNVGINVKDCAFQGTSASATFNNCLDYTGAQGANSTIVSNCNLSGFTGSGIIVNGGGSSLVVNNTVIQGLWGTATQAAVAGINCRVVGALQVTNCDILGAINNLLVAPQAAEVAASIQICNTFFDNALGSCIKVSGAGATVRMKFEECTFTTSNGGTGFSAVELASTFAYSANGQAIDFNNCNILNTFATTGTTFGFLVSGTAELGLSNCRVAGWTTGVQVTPLATAGRTKLIFTGNTIGNTGDYPANTTGISLLVGGAAYGTVQIFNNNLAGNTTALLDASTIAASTQRLVGDNIGMVDGMAKVTANNAATTTTVETVVLQLPLPANSVKVGTTFRYTLVCHPALTTVTTCRVRIGSAGTIADASVIIMSATAVTNAATRYLTGITSVNVSGASATHIGAGIEEVGAITAVGVATAATGTFNSTVANFVSVTLQNTSTTTTTVYSGVLEITDP